MKLNFKFLSFALFSALSMNVMAGQTTKICLNEIEEFTIKLEKTNNRITGLEVDMPGLDANTRKDFKYTDKEITTAGETFVFEKSGKSSSEIMIQKVSEITEVAMLKVHYLGSSQTVLMKCI